MADDKSKSDDYSDEPKSTTTINPEMMMSTNRRVDTEHLIECNNRSHFIAKSRTAQQSKHESSKEESKEDK